MEDTSRGSSKIVTNDLKEKVVFFVVLVVLLVTVISVLIWQGGKPEEEVSEPTPTPEQAEENVTPTPSVDVSPEVSPEVSPQPSVEEPSPTPVPTQVPEILDEVYIRAFEFAYEPALITAKAGEKFKIRLENTGETDHSFVIDELDIDSGVIKPGETKEAIIQVPVNEQNEYKYYCSVDDHRSSGMEGRIVIAQ